MEGNAKWKTVFSRFLRAGPKAFFFDVNEGEKGGRWLSVSESRQMEDGKYVRSRLFVFPDVVGQFMTCLQEAVDQLGAPGAARRAGKAAAIDE